MIELVQVILLFLVFAGHVNLLLERHLDTVERQQGFAEFWIDGRFVKFIDLR